MTRRYFILDVFASAALQGNPLAVVLDPDGLDDATLQAIAREFNLSETTFVFPPDTDRHKARVRIFTPANELPFAGHPTIGTAALLALLTGEDASAFGLELLIGTVPCVVQRVTEGTAKARFRAAKLPEPAGEPVAIAAAAEALGLDSGDIVDGAHRISRFSAGVPYDCVPVASLDALGRAKPRGSFSRTFRGAHPSAYVYTNLGSGQFRARMFAPDLGVPEDPATGSAAVAFAGALMAAHAFPDGAHDIVIEQGVEMGRPSRLDMQLIVESGALTGVELAGNAVIVAEGRLRV
jgi:trans-2,3-dihydro-3-hydroxyanthranilate isomerase